MKIKKKTKQDILWLIFGSLSTVILLALIAAISGCYTKAGKSTDNAQPRAYIVANNQASSSNTAEPDYLVKAERKNKKWQEIRSSIFHL